jgi:hypothetical protein
MSLSFLLTDFIYQGGAIRAASPRLSHYFVIALTIYLCTIANAYGQSSVGNGSSIAPAAGQQGNYGINNPSAVGVDYRTRHFRRRDNTGIGSSFLGTTSPTSEGSPALRSVSPATTQTSALQFRLPKLESIFPESNINPALNSFSPALPELPRSSALSSPTMNVSSFRKDFSDSTQETVPSFSRSPSFSDKMQFNSFDSSGNFNR